MILKFSIFVISVIFVASSHCRVVENAQLQKDSISLDFSENSHPGLEGLTKLIHQTCLKDLTADAEEYQTLKDAHAELDECMNSVFNKTRLNMDFDPERSIIDGMCAKEGNEYLLSQYHTKGGYKCAIEKKTQLQDCFQLHYHKHTNDVTLEERCDKISALGQCIVRELKTCSQHETKVAARFFESLYNVMETAAPCKRDIGKGAVMNSISGTTKLETMRLLFRRFLF